VISRAQLWGKTKKGEKVKNRNWFLLFEGLLKKKKRKERERPEGGRPYMIATASVVVTQAMGLMLG
jgi:hypothetical protein